MQKTRIHTALLTAVAISSLISLTPTTSAATWFDRDEDGKYDVHEIPDFQYLKTQTEINLFSYPVETLEGLSELTNTQILRLSYVHLPEIEANAFQGLNALDYLSMSGSQNMFNNYISLDANAFQGLSNLSYLSLGTRKLNPLSLGTFSPLQNLKTLNLGDFQSSTIRAGLFNGLSNLETLYLRGYHETQAGQDFYSGYIRKFEDGAFQGLDNLQALDLQMNPIQLLKTNKFMGMPNLKTLKLNDNISLWEIQLGAFNGLSKLEELDLSNSRFSRAEHYLGPLSLVHLRKDGFKPLSNLKKLDLQDCQLEGKYIQTGAFNGLDSLEYLKLEDNPLETIHAGMFQGLGNLKILSLGRFFDVSDLGWTSVKTLEPGAFEHLQSLETLYIPCTSFQTLDLTRASLLNLKSFYRAYTPLEEIILTQAKINQTGFDAIMNDTAVLIHAPYNEARVSNIVLDQIDFSGFNNFNSLFAGQFQTNLESISLKFARNLDEQMILQLIDSNNLSALNHLDLYGTWDKLAPQTQTQLQTWALDAEHTLIIPEPCSSLLLLGSLGLLGTARIRRN